MYREYIIIYGHIFFDLSNDLSKTNALRSKKATGATRLRRTMVVTSLGRTIDPKSFGRPMGPTCLGKAKSFGRTMGLKKMIYICMNVYTYI